MTGPTETNEQSTQKLWLAIHTGGKYEMESTCRTLLQRQTKAITVFLKQSVKENVSTGAKDEGRSA